MTRNLDSDASSAGDRARSRAYSKEFWPGIVGYGVLLTASLVWGDLDGASPWRYVWAVLPVLPALWIVRAVLRHLRRVDDYQRALLLQGLGVGFAVAMITALTLGFLGIAGLPMAASGWVVYAAGMLGWLITSQIAGRR